MLRQAVIMAGGFGTRLRPLTLRRPKPMVPVVGMPIMERVVRHVRRYGIRRLVCLLYHQGEHIRNYFGTGAAWDVEIEYVQAEADYGTAGSVRNAAELLAPEPFLVISADVLTTLDLAAAFQWHCTHRAMATLLLMRVPHPLPYGIVFTDADGRIVRFLEKPSWSELFSDTVNTGIYVLEPQVLELIPYRQEYDFGKDLFPEMLHRGLPLYGYVGQGYWRDIGNLGEYFAAHRDFFAGRLQLELEGQPRGEGVVCGEGVEIAPTARLSGRVVLGAHVRVGPGAELSNCVLGRGCVIAPGARVLESILWEEVVVGAGAEIRSAVVAAGSRIEEDATVEEQVVIGEQCIVGRGATLSAGVKLWAGKSVEAGAVLTQSLVQEERWLRGVFLNAKVSGIPNVDITPEFAARLGTALGSAIAMGTMVAVSRDPSSVARMVLRALGAGLLSTGVHVADLQVASVPQMRQELRSGRYAAGVHVRRSPRNPEYAELVVFDADGRDIPLQMAKRIERILYGEEFRRVAAHQIGRLSFAERSAESYIERVLAALDREAIARRSFSVLVDYSCGLAAQLFPQILGRLGCRSFALNNIVEAAGECPPLEEPLVAQAMRALGCQVAFRIDPGAEWIAVMDQQGRWYPSMRLLTLVLKLFLLLNVAHEPYAIAVPMAASMEVEQVAAQHNVRIVRVGNSHSAMMEATRDPEVRFVGGTRGGFIFPEFLFAADGMFSAAKLLEMLARSPYDLAELDLQLPRRFQQELLVPCPWGRKAAVLRRALEYPARERLLLDGVKLLLEDGSTVVLFPEQQTAHMVLITDADSEELARQHAQSFAELIQQWQQ